jgi:hypothetical protein
MRIVYLIVIPVAFLAGCAWALHAWLYREPERVFAVDEVIEARGLILRDADGKKRIEMAVHDDYATFTIQTPDGSGRVRISATRDEVQISAAEGTQFIGITPQGTRKGDMKSNTVESK